MHDPTKVLLGTTESNVREVDNRSGEIEAGLAVRLDTDDAIKLTAGSLLGISLGKDLSLIGRTAILRKGLGVPLQLTAEFTPAIGAQVHISATTGKAVTSGGGALPTNAVYRALKTGVKEDGVTEVAVAIVDMVGGL